MPWKHGNEVPQTPTTIVGPMPSWVFVPHRTIGTFVILQPPSDFAAICDLN